MKTTPISFAVKMLSSELVSDADFRMTYQANIAMAFYDEYNRVKREQSKLGKREKVCPKCMRPQAGHNRKCWNCGAKIPPLQTVNIHEIANKAAHNFLNQFCESNLEYQKP